MKADLTPVTTRPAFARPEDEGGGAAEPIFRKPTARYVFVRVLSGAVPEIASWGNKDDVYITPKALPPGLTF